MRADLNKFIRVDTNKGDPKNQRRLTLQKAKRMSRMSAEEQAVAKQMTEEPEEDVFKSVGPLHCLLSLVSPVSIGRNVSRMVWH